MPSLITKTILNRWTPATPVRADFGSWIAYLSIDGAAARAAAETGRAATDARARLLAGAVIEHRDGSTYRLVPRPGE